METTNYSKTVIEVNDSEQQTLLEFKRQILHLEIKSVIKIIKLVLESDSTKLAKYEIEKIIEYNRFVAAYNRCYKYNLGEADIYNYETNYGRINTWTRYCDLIFDNGYTALESASKIIQKAFTPKI